jgi:hypothetical protein
MSVEARLRHHCALRLVAHNSSNLSLIISPHFHGLSLSNNSGYKTDPSHQWRFYIVKKASKRRAWTSVQIRELKTLAKRKVPAGKIARTMRRTEGATRQKAFAIGLSLDSR